MRYRIRQELSGKKGVISNTNGFVSMYLDGGFREKWNGYWSPSRKYLDYFAAKVNGVWLNSETLEEICYCEKLVQRHRVSKLLVKQEVSCPENIPGFRIDWEVENRSSEDKAVMLSLEPAVDIRSRGNDIAGGDYSVDASNAGIKVSKEDNYISVSGRGLEFGKGNYVKEHYPGEKQVCLVLDEIFWKTELASGEKKEAEAVFRTDGKVECREIDVDGELRHEKLGRTFNHSMESLANLYYGQNGSGIIAGHPWFQNYWARDSFWSALGMIDAGMFEETERLLQNFGQRKDFPSTIMTDGGSESEYPRCDSLPLFAIAAEKLDRFKGSSDVADRARELLERERPNGKIVDHSPGGTWMDTLERERAVDIQSLWIEALERFDMDASKLRKGLEEFEKEGYMADNLEDDFESINPAVPLMFGQVEDGKAAKYLEKINGEFSSRYGARTRSVTDHGYDPSGYHTGSVWGLTTCWAAAANLSYGKKNHGVNFLKKLSNFLDRNQLGGLPEVVDGETGRSLGCDEQAWSAGLLVHVIDSYMLGIDVKNGKLVVDPVEGIDAERRSKKVLGENLDLRVKNGKAEIVNSPDLEVELK